MNAWHYIVYYKMKAASNVSYILKLSNASPYFRGDSHSRVKNNIRSGAAGP